ncbi:MAG: hypothetical protein V4654_01100 [Bdellovibrionota bacterium]
MSLTQKLLVTFFSILTVSFSALAYNVNPNKISLSGISAGAFFAHQMQVTYSQTLTGGVAMIAGGSYNCSRGSLNTAMNSCMKISGLQTSVDQTHLDILNLSKSKKIDSFENIAKTKVFLISGKFDDVVFTPVVDKVEELYLKLNVPTENIKYNKSIEMGHAFPTLNYGNKCSSPRSAPFISNCNYDGAYEILSFFYGALENKKNEIAKNLLPYSQSSFFAAKFGAQISMSDTAAVYVPTRCQLGEECSLHVAFHGCLQSRQDIGDDYLHKLGFNDWAESNNIIVLYPQVTKNYFLGNPNACWDWWGYTGADYANKNSVQMNIVYKMIQDLIKK